MAEEADELKGIEEWVAASTEYLLELLQKMNINELRFLERACGLIAPLSNDQETGRRFWGALESLATHQYFVRYKREVAELERIYGADE